MGSNKVVGIGIALVSMSVLLMIAVYINSAITPAALNSATYDTTTTINESLTVLNDTARIYAFANSGVAEWIGLGNVITCVEVINDTHVLGAANYSCNNAGLNATSFPTLNESTWNVTYSYGTDSATHTAIRGVRSTFLSSMTLAVIVLIVLAASGVMMVVMGLGRG